MRTMVAGITLFMLCSGGAVQAQNSLTIGDLAPDTAAQLRCTMLAGLVLYEHKRGKQPSYGLTDDVKARLDAMMAARLARDHGASADVSRALTHADFEAFSADMLKDGKPVKAKAMLAKGIKDCRNAWDMAIKAPVR